MANLILPICQQEIYSICQKMQYCPSSDVKGILHTNGFGMAAVLYDTWTWTGVQVHVYAPDLRLLFHPKFLREIFRYPFVDGGKKVLIAVTPAHQKGSLAVSGWLGFKEKYRIKDGWSNGIDMVLKELRREDCRFILQDVKCAS